jgi:HAD superfamily hydrolase (TIGR01493 family)
VGALLETIVSVDDVKTYKPNPSVYHHLARRLATQPHQVWLVSAKAWDVIGARAAGCGQSGCAAQACRRSTPGERAGD